MNNFSNKSIKSICFLFGGLLLFNFQISNAQKSDLDSKGKEFWVSFLENFGSLGFGEESRLVLYASCDKLTNVSVYFGNDPTTQYKFPITKINTTFEIPIPFDMELNSNDTGVSNKSILILADDEITLYGANIRTLSADAFLGFPEDVLTRHYIVLSYPNGYSDQLGTGNGTFDMPSEFSIVAPYDGTEIKINPSPGTYINSRIDDNQFIVKLNKGEVFFGQAKTGIFQDVSGTELSSTKPIAVFAGVRRTSIPVSVGNYRDHLCEQIPPLQIWGTKVIATPHFPIAFYSPYKAVIRVLAAIDNTNWTINGVVQKPLQKGVSTQVNLDLVMFISADNPILVAQYEHSVGPDESGNGFGIGDPFMMIIPPYEQYDSIYSVQSIIDSGFDYHFMNVIVSKYHTDSLTIDGTIPNANYIDVPGTHFVYAQIEVTPGSHLVKCDSAFGLCLYGFGNANSYGYIGGIVFKKIFFDYQPPLIEDSIKCDELSGIAFDSRIIDSGIDSCYALQINNINLNIDNFKSTKDTVKYKAKLLDQYLDGFLGIIAIDSSGRSRSQFTSIPGFTVRSVGMTNSALNLDTIIHLNNQVVCRDFEIENYGKFPRTISKISIQDSLQELITNGSIKIIGQLPITLKPNEKAKFQICVEGWVRNYPITTIFKIADSCFDREVISISIIGITDTVPPNLKFNLRPCGSEADYIVTESIGKSAGISNVQFDLLNCSLTNDSVLKNLPSFYVDFNLQLINKFQDGFVKITTTDFAGNKSYKTDTLFGFTIKGVNPQTSDSVGLRYMKDYLCDTISYNKWRTDTLIISNFGLGLKIISKVNFKNNISFSVAPSIFPLVIKPGRFAKLPVNIYGSQVNSITDTLILNNDCNVEEQIPFTINIKADQSFGDDWCKNRILFNPTNGTNINFIQTPIPNPIKSRIAKVDIGLKNDDEVNLNIYSLKGEKLIEIIKKEYLKKGIHRLTLDFNKLVSGSYYLGFSTKNNIESFTIFQIIN